MEHKKDLDFNAKLYGKQRFGFRKISVGLAAVALGTTFFLSNSQLVHADENNASQQTTEVKENAQTVDSDQQNVETKTDNSTSSEISSKDNTQESSSNNKNGDSTASQEK
ncbi:YSIRK-type signal peptide-containing protein [Lactobacillus amylovorus]|nr:YSIRK-type signal peptide-containing protein [Lactobacillus amylovorus]